MLKMINFVGHINKEKVDAYLLTIATDTNGYPIWYPVYKTTPEFSSCFRGLNSWLNILKNVVIIFYLEILGFLLNLAKGFDSCYRSYKILFIISLRVFK